MTFTDDNSIIYELALLQKGGREINSIAKYLFSLLSTRWQRG